MSIIVKPASFGLIEEDVSVTDTTTCSEVGSIVGSVLCITASPSASFLTVPVGLLLAVTLVGPACTVSVVDEPSFEVESVGIFITGPSCRMLGLVVSTATASLCGALVVASELGIMV